MHTDDRGDDATTGPNDDRTRHLLLEGGPYVGETAARERDAGGRVTGWEVCTYRCDRVG
jgi:hypothetical protein